MLAAVLRREGGVLKYEGLEGSGLAGMGSRGTYLSTLVYCRYFKYIVFDQVLWVPNHVRGSGSLMHPHPTSTGTGTISGVEWFSASGSHGRDIWVGT